MVLHLKLFKYMGYPLSSTAGRIAGCVKVSHLLQVRIIQEHGANSWTGFILNRIALITLSACDGLTDLFAPRAATSMRLIEPAGTA
jgi:hypothetical protein